MRTPLLSVLTLAALAVLVALPALFVLLQGVFPHLAAGSLAQAFSAAPVLMRDPQVPALIGGTLITGLGVALACALLGIPLGALRALFAVPLARVWDVLILIPFLTPPYIAGLSWMLALQRRGYVQQLTGLQFDHLLFSRTGIILVMSLNIFPVVYFSVSRAMASEANRLAEVARVHGASSWQAFRLINLPLALPAILAGLLLAFTLAIEEYGVPAALGTRAGAAVLTVGIEQRLADWPIDLTSASLLSLLLVALALTAYAIQRALTRGRDVAVAGGKPVAIASRPLGPWRLPVLMLFGLVCALAVAAPLTAMLLTAFSGTLSGGLSIENLTLRHFSALLSRHGEAAGALGTSLGLAFGSALITGAVGFLVAWRISNVKNRTTALIDALSLLPAALPGVVVAVGLILAWNRSFWPLTPYDSWVILLLAYSCLLLPYPVRYAAAALRQIGDTLEPAARVHGANAGRALRSIVLPLVFPTLLAAMLMVFAIASRELVASLLLSPPGVQTVSVFIWRQFEQGSVGDGMAMATLAMGLSIMIMLTALGLLQRQRS